MARWSTFSLYLLSIIIIIIIIEADHTIHGLFYKIIDYHNLKQLTTKIIVYKNPALRIRINEEFLWIFQQQYTYGQ